ncbi:MAG: UDP-N-acetylmuramoyl-tripeptide--D-alanyl-D-alanine ligase [Ruminococcaceae bacterium]|nr:UDP-N-acetylmuramoyl-tripeptide--D-alanyl-D-alanine ligase [Oscillospiraceae bacterium]
MRKKSNGTVELIGKNTSPIKVCDVINGKPKVKRKIKKDYIEFVLRYSIFHREIKRYNKKTFEEIK